MQRNLMNIELRWHFCVSTHTVQATRPQNFQQMRLFFEECCIKCEGKGT